MKQNVYIAVFALVTTLTGCNGAVKNMAELFPTGPLAYVIAPGYEIAINGRPAEVFGRSKCSEKKYL